MGSIANEGIKKYQNQINSTNQSSTVIQQTIRGKQIQQPQSNIPGFIDSSLKRCILSERIQLATQLMIDSRQQQGAEIINRYKTVISLNKNWPQVFIINFYR